METGKTWTQCLNQKNSGKSERAGSCDSHKKSESIYKRTEQENTKSDQDHCNWYENEKPHGGLIKQCLSDLT